MVSDLRQPITAIKQVCRTAQEPTFSQQVAHQLTCLTEVRIRVALLQVTLLESLPKLLKLPALGSLLQQQECCTRLQIRLVIPLPALLRRQND